MKTFERNKSVFIVFVSLLLVSFLYASISCTPAFAQPKAEYKEGVLLVKFKKDVPASSVANVHAALGSRVLKHFKRTSIEKVQLKPGLTTKEAVKQYRKNPNVEYAEPDYKRYYQSAPPNDPGFVEQWALDNIDALEAWDMTTEGTDVVVAVNDTGVDYNHEDLKANMWTNSGETGMTQAGDVCWTGTSEDKRTNNCDDDENGYIDDIYGVNLLNEGNDPMDPNSHGTACAGIIAAEGNNYLGITGIGWQHVKILAVRGGTAYMGTSSSTFVEAIEYVMMMKERGNNIRVISCSIAGYSEWSSLAEHDAIKAAGDADILVVAGAGNSGEDNDAAPRFPASYDLGNIISVAASDHNDDRAVWEHGGSSNWGRYSVDVAAPGKDNLTTLSDVFSPAVPDININIDGRYGEDKYRLFGGTSGATPHVAAICALVWSRYPELTWEGVKALVLNSVDPVDAFRHDGDTPILTEGRVNAQKAVQGCSSTGSISLDLQDLFYKVPNTVTIGLADCDLNLNSGAVDTVNIVISSDTEPSGETVTLTEVGPDVGYFQGTLDISLSDSGGTLWVSNGDTITATYEDASPAGTRIATATVDAIAPTISNVSADPYFTGESATIAFNTDEDSYSMLFFGDSADDLDQKAYGRSLATSHSIQVNGLLPGETYYYDCKAVDPAGNETIDKAGGDPPTHYSVTMPCVAKISVSPLQLQMSAVSGEIVRAYFDIENTIGCDSLTFTITSDSPNWLTAEPSGGTTVQPGGSQTITVTANATSLAPRPGSDPDPDPDYSGALTIESNDPFQPSYNFDVFLYVTEPSSWAKTYGTVNFDYSSSIQQTSDDGGYIVAGGTDDGSGLNHDVLIFKLDSAGNVQWGNVYGGDYSDDAQSVQQTSDGGYIVAGSTESFGAGQSDILVLKLDSTGIVQWAKTFGNNKIDRAYSIQQTFDGGYVLAAERVTDSYGDCMAFVIKLDQNGDTQWKTRLGISSNFHTLKSIQQTSDGGYIAAGEADTPNRGIDAWVVKFNADGSVAWQKKYGRANSITLDDADSIHQTLDGGYIVSGWTVSWGDGAWIFKIDSNGTLQWAKKYGSDWRDRANSVQQTNDDGYIVGGFLYSPETTYDACIFKLDSNGNAVWQKAYGNSSDDRAYSVQQRSDGSFIMAGTSYSFGAGNKDVFVLKLNSSGDIPDCGNQLADPTDITDITDVSEANTDVNVEYNPTTVNEGSPNIVQSSYGLSTGLVCQ